MALLAKSAGALSSLALGSAARMFAAGSLACSRGPLAVPSSSGDASSASQQAGSQGPRFNEMQRFVGTQHGQDLLNGLRPSFAPHLVASKKEEEKAPAPSQPFLPPRPLFGQRSFGSLATPRMPSTAQLLRRTGPIQQQRRNYNAWSPVQRYFVEGDHVVTAEANRTFQFTGLDAGSFYPFVVYTAVATVIASAFMVIPFLVAPSRVDLDKSSAYECGFDAFGEARQTFSVSFYLVSIMYLLFDIEIAYLFPYVMSHANSNMFWTMNLFLSILVVGFVYEWGVGALEWRE